MWTSSGFWVNRRAFALHDRAYVCAPGRDGLHFAPVPGNTKPFRFTQTAKAFFLLGRFWGGESVLGRLPSEL
jgi:hypothetical protein